MPRIDETLPLVPSILDRLLDEDPDTQQDTVKTRSQVLREMKQSVRRDLEHLLNTRINWQEYSDQLEELTCSLVNYGLPDFSSANLATSTNRKQFTQLIEETIRRYETRFKYVSVSLLTNSEPLDRTMRLKIDAMLYAEPEPEPITFNSIVEPVNCSLEISPGKA